MFYLGLLRWVKSGRQIKYAGMVELVDTQDLGAVTLVKVYCSISGAVISKTEYAPVMELVDMRDLGSCVSNSTALPLKNPLSIDIARFFSGPFVLDFGGYFGVLSSVLSCHLVHPYGHLFPDVL